MLSINTHKPAVFTALLGAGLALASPLQSLAQSQSADAQIQADENKQMDNKRLRDVKAQVASGVVTLTGTVSTLHDKMDAGKKAQKVHNVASVQNQVQVAGAAEVPDRTIGEKLASKLTVNQQSLNRTAFQYISVSVQDGVVTLNGLVTQPVDKLDAEATVEDQPGVKGLVDNLQVAPTSPNDDRIRLDLYRAIYGYGGFTRYAIDPAKTIRILVVNGNATLMGIVDSKGDKDMAALRAGTVAGVFKVTNDLRVNGQKE